MKIKKIAKVSVIIIVIISIIWFEMPSIDAEIALKETELTTFSQAVYVTQRLIHEIKLNLDVSERLSGENSLEYNLTMIKYTQAVSQLEELYDSFPFSLNLKLNIANNGKVQFRIKDIQATAMLDNHNLNFKMSEFQFDLVKPGETIKSAIVLEAMEKESSRSLYNQTNLQGDITITITLRARLKTRLVVKTVPFEFTVLE
jgi:hypothetical protein